jgi:predicted alpha/beta-hydrolase family hydrolase
VVEEFIGLGVRAFLQRGSGNDGIILTHGAGTNCEAPLLRDLSAALVQRGMWVLRYDLPFRQARPSGPPIPGDAVKDREGIRAAVAAMRGLVSGRVIAGGHSYGGRQTSMAAAESVDLADGIVLLSYPLHPPRKINELRTAHFPKLCIPTLFIHGTRDPFGLPDEMRSALSPIPGCVELELIEGAGHDLNKPTGAPRIIAERILDFVSVIEGGAIASETSH